MFQTMAYRYNGEFFVGNGNLSTLACVPIMEMLTDKLIENKPKNPQKYDDLDDFVKAAMHFDKVIVDIMGFMKREVLVKRSYLWEDFSRKLASVREWGIRAREDVYLLEVEPDFMRCFSNILFYKIRGLAIPGLSMRNKEN